MRSVIEIVTAAESELLTTLARVKRELNVSNNANDDLLKDKIAEASSDIELAIGARLPREDVRETFWHDEAEHLPSHRHHHHTSAQTTLFLTRRPAIEITGVTVDDEPLDAADSWRVDPDAGLLDRLSDGRPCAWRFCRSVVVNYSAGYVLPDQGNACTLPRAIEGAVVALVSSYWASRGRDPLLRSEDIPGVIRREFWVGAVGDPQMLPPRILASLDPVRRRLFAVA
jgi:hypothetical protein